MSKNAIYDVAVLGSGPGGYVAAIRAGQLGLSSVVIEKRDTLGGTCLHVGCIPSKAFLHTAELLDRIRHAKDHGVIVDSVLLDWSALKKRKERVIRKNAAGIAYLFKKNNVDVVQGFGRLAGPGKVEVSGPNGIQTVYARHIIIATGSEASTLSGLEVDGHNVLTNVGMFDLSEQPKHLGIIGAGAVGVEFASMFHSFGTKVTLIEVLPRIVPAEDEEISSTLERSFTKRGIQTLTSTKVDKVQNQKTSVNLEIILPDGKQEQRMVDKLLVAVGRKPNTEGIGLESVGIESERGTIVVNEFMETSASGVFAIGDVVKSQQLAHVASAEGILAVETIAGHKTKPMNYQHMPGATYCSPEIGSVGLTAVEARKRGYDVREGKFPFSASSKATILGEREGFVKVVTEVKYDELLGVHIIGPHATDLIAEAVLALELEATSEALMRVVHAHPTLSEAVGEAASSALGKPIHV